MRRITPWLAIGATLLAGGCETVLPATAGSYAECDRVIAAYGKQRPGFVDVEEWGQRSWDSFRGAYDANGDGKVDRAELIGKFQPPLNAPGRAMYDREQARNFRRLDRANKGFIDRADVIRDATPGFRWQDRNHDGWLSREECALRRRTYELI
ncbi:MAG: hypothetical protein JSR98_19900 [Proteobacteria bacterium]|nr:hypothetical protein [Pseudomonadota bacterium]